MPKCPKAPRILLQQQELGLSNEYAAFIYGAMHNALIIPCGGLILCRCIGHERRLVRLAALGWSDRLAYVGVLVFAEAVVAWHRRHVLPLAFVLPVSATHRQHVKYA